MNAQLTPAYLVAKLTVKNHKEYIERYGMPVVEVLEQYGAEVLAASPNPEAIEGEWESNWTVIIRFPSMAKAKEFYASPEYTPFRSLRINELIDKGAIGLVEGFDPAVLAR